MAVHESLSLLLLLAEGAFASRAEQETALSLPYPLTGQTDSYMLLDNGLGAEEENGV